MCIQLSYNVTSENYLRIDVNGKQLLDQEKILNKRFIRNDFHSQQKNSLNIQSVRIH